MPNKNSLRVLSGIQPSGSLHLGNYFGMMSRMIKYQSQNELFCFIANYHALTTLPDSKSLSSNTFNAACDFLALGLDPEKSTFWVQSDVPEVAELTWILSSQVGVGLMDRATSYKDKISSQSDHILIDIVKNKYPDMDANKATAISLYSRYLKRVAAHSKNLISSIVNPFERIGYGEK